MQFWDPKDQEPQQSPCRNRREISSGNTQDYGLFEHSNQMIVIRFGLYLDSSVIVNLSYPRYRAVPWVPETFLARFPVSVKSL